MNQNNEQIEMIGELLQQLIHRFTSLEKKVTQLSEQKQPEYITELNTVNEELARFKRDFNTMTERLTAQTTILADRTAKIPHEIPVQQHHLFDRWAKGFIISSTVMLLFTAISVGGCLSLWSENKLLHANALKFRMIQQVNPTTARWADSIYFRDPAEAELVTQKAEAEQLSLKQAEPEAANKQEEARLAKQKAAALKKNK